MSPIDAGKRHADRRGGGRARPHRRGVRDDLRDPGRRADVRRARHVLAHVERALQLQALAADPRPLPDQRPARPAGPGRERRRHRRRRRLGGRVQGREPQPPERGRALPGRGHRRRRHRARHLHHGRAARASCLDSLRFGELDTSRASATCSTASSAASPTTATASASRPSAARSTSSASYERQLPRQRDVRRPDRAPTSIVRAVAAGVGNLVVLIGSTTGRDGIGGASVLASQEFDETPRGEAPDASRSATRSRRRSSSRPASSCSTTSHWSSLQDLGAAGLTSLVQRDGRARAASGSTSTSTACRCARPTWSPSRSWSPSPRSACSRSSSRRELDDGAGRLRALGPRLHGHRRGHRHEDAARLLARRGGRRHPGAALADESPVIRTPSVEPAYLVDEPVAVDRRRATRAPHDLGAALRELLAAPNIASKRWAFEQYDYIVQANTVQIPGSDAAVLRIKGTPARHRRRQRLQRAPLLPRPVPRRARPRSPRRRAT